MLTVERPCPACGADSYRTLGRIAAEPPAPPGPWTVVECTGCGSGYLRPRPESPADLYAHGYHVYGQHGRLADRVRSMSAWLEAWWAGRLIAPGSRVFEIGCGTGEILAAFARRGFEVAGLEFSADAARAARERGLAVEHGSIDAADGGRPSGFDLVFSAHVLEHVAEPHRFLAEVHRLLRPGGVAVIKTPLAGSWAARLLGPYASCFDVPYHVVVPSRQALTRMLAGAGLVLERWIDDTVPNDFINGSRHYLRVERNIDLPFCRPWNPLLAALFWPVSLAAAGARASARARLIVRRPA